MVRVAVAMIVWSRAARNMPIIRPARIVRIWRWVKSADIPAFAGAPPGGPAGAVAVVLALLTKSPVGLVLSRGASVPRRSC
ncbi:hypothetical protein KRM28CT15_17300 [Krasilnikovia sp. M28-CT-15]